MQVFCNIMSDTFAFPAFIHKCIFYEKDLLATLMISKRGLWHGTCANGTTVVCALSEENVQMGTEKSFSFLSLLFVFKLRLLEATVECAQRGCDVVSMSGPLWYSTLRWKTSQTVLAHHCSNYQQQECPFISITSFFLSSYCSPSSALPLLSSLPLVHSPPLISTLFF